MALSVDDLPKTVNFEKNANEWRFEIKMLNLENSKVNADSNNFPLLQSIDLFCEERGVIFLLFITGFTVAARKLPWLQLFHIIVGILLFNSHSRNQHGVMIPNGKSVLL